MADQLEPSTQPVSPSPAPSAIPPTPVPPGQNKSLVYIVIGCIVLLVLGGAAYTYWYLNQRQIASPADVAENAPSEAPLAVPSIDITKAQEAPVMIIPSEWTTYTAESAGYSFQYPAENTQVDETNNGIEVSRCDGACTPFFTVAVSSDYTGTSQTAWMQTKGLIADEADYTIAHVTIDSLPLTLIVSNAQTGPAYAVITNDQTAYLFTFDEGSSPENEGIMKQILASFKRL